MNASFVTPNDEDVFSFLFDDRELLEGLGLYDRFLRGCFVYPCITLLPG